MPSPSRRVRRPTLRSPQKNHILFLHHIFTFPSSFPERDLLLCFFYWSGVLFDILERVAVKTGTEPESSCSHKHTTRTRFSSWGPTACLPVPHVMLFIFMGKPSAFIFLRLQEFSVWPRSSCASSTSNQIDFSIITHRYCFFRRLAPPLAASSAEFALIRLSAILITLPRPIIVAPQPATPLRSAPSVSR
jgi:hypothetical protein